MFTARSATAEIAVADSVVRIKENEDILAVTQFNDVKLVGDKKGLEVVDVAFIQKLSLTDNAEFDDNLSLENINYINLIGDMSIHLRHNNINNVKIIDELVSQEVLKFDNVNKVNFKDNIVYSEIIKAININKLSHTEQAVLHNIIKAINLNRASLLEYFRINLFWEEIEGEQTDWEVYIK